MSLVKGYLPLLFVVFANACVEIPPEPSPCDRNAAPSVRPPTTLVGGRSAQVAPIGSRVLVVAHVDDVDDNLTGGTIGATWSGPRASGANTVGLRPTRSGERALVDLDLSWVRTPGDYTYVVTATDRCGAASELSGGRIRMVAKDASYVPAASGRGSTTRRTDGELVGPKEKR